MLEDLAIRPRHSAASHNHTRMPPNPRPQSERCQRITAKPNLASCETPPGFRAFTAASGLSTDPLPNALSQVGCAGCNFSRRVRRCRLRATGVPRAEQLRHLRPRSYNTPESRQSRCSCPNPAWGRGLRHFQHVKPQGPYGIRTRAAAVRGRCPRPLDEWAVANAECSGRSPARPVDERCSGRARERPGQAVADGAGASVASGSRASIRSSKRRRISSPVARRS